MYNGKLNNIRYDNSRKLMKQVNFKVKKSRRTNPRRTIYYHVEIYSQNI